MPNIILYRTPSTKHGTFGYLFDGELPLCLTLEDPWNDNKRNMSSIPAGVYECRKYSGTKFKDVWKLSNVPGRSDILIHQGNSIDDTSGCILVGEAVAEDFHGKPAVLDSNIAMHFLRTYLPAKFKLTIVEPFEPVDKRVTNCQKIVNMVRSTFTKGKYND